MVIEQAKTRALPLLNRVPDVAPAAQACCGVCRGCVTTNVFAAAGFALVGAASWVAHRFRFSSKPA